MLCTHLAFLIPGAHSNKEHRKIKILLAFVNFRYNILTLIMPMYLNFHPLEVVSRYRDPQLQVAENYAYLFNLIPHIHKS